jgi:lipopolysaccharide biosynthesis protein
MKLERRCVPENRHYAAVRIDELNAVEADALRFWWLTHDHDSSEEREKVRTILRRMEVMSASAVRAYIDAALTAKEQT